MLPPDIHSLGGARNSSSQIKTVSLSQLLLLLLLPTRSTRSARFVLSRGPSNAQHICELPPAFRDLYYPLLCYISKPTRGIRRFLLSLIFGMVYPRGAAT